MIVGSTHKAYALSKKKKKTKAKYCAVFGPNSEMSLQGSSETAGTKSSLERTAPKGSLVICMVHLIF